MDGLLRDFKRFGSFGEAAVMVEQFRVQHGRELCPNSRTYVKPYGRCLRKPMKTGKDVRTMRQLFRDRLREAAAYAGVEYSPTAIGRALGLSKQTVHAWMTSGEPRPAMLFHIADSWRVDARWLATGEGTMTPPPGGPGLSADEIEVIKRYRKAEPRNRASIIAVAKSLAKVATIVAFVTSGAAFNKTAFAQDQQSTHWPIWLRRLAFKLLSFGAQAHRNSANPIAG